MNIYLTPKPTELPKGTIIGLESRGKLSRHPASKLLKPNDLGFIDGALSAEKEWTAQSALILPLPSSPSHLVFIIGTGEKKERTLYSASLQARRALTLLKTKNVDDAVLWLADFNAPKTKTADTLRSCAVNIIMADYAHIKYKVEPKGGWPIVKNISIVADRADTTLKRALHEGIILGEETNACRNLSNTPGGDMTPATLAGAALATAEETKSLSVTVLDEKEIKKLGMGGVLGVSRGSSEKPKFIILKYWGGRKADKPYVYIGKGVTFDTGGLNLKPGTSINEMHMDMSGGAATIHAVSAIAKLKLKINVIGLIPAVENMPSGSSYHPGDILKTLGGKTIEVLNTDAEGRIILADALGYAKQFEPALVVDVATLTGASVVALGQRVSCLFTNDSKLEKLGKEVGEASGDRVWPMPTWDEYAEEIRGTFADVRNTGKTRYGGAITAAVFLKQFTNYPWMHIDITPRMTTISGEYLSQGAAGAGVRFLVELARRKS